MDAGAARSLKRAQQAQQLLLDLPRESAEVQTTLEALMQIPRSFSRLTALSLRAWPHREEDLQSLIMAVAYITGQAKRLVFLSIDVESLPHLPSLSHIRHLQLAVSGDSLLRLAPALGNLVTLQTLCCSSKLEQSAEPLAHLDLLALTQLESMMLDGVVPASLKLPEFAALHAITYSLEEAEESFWPSVLPPLGPLKSFTLEASEDIKHVEDIPNWMLEPVKLYRLVLAVKSFGLGYENENNYDPGEIRLRGAFLRAEEFCLRVQGGALCEVASRARVETGQPDF